MREGRLLGIDFGTKRIGLALSDEGAVLASPREVVYGGLPALREVIDKIRETEGLVGIVVGMPFNMDGTEGAKATQVREFGRWLERTFKLPVEFTDERLTSVEADDAMRAAGLNVRQRRERIDRVAARIILQSYLDRQSQARGADVDLEGDVDDP